ncbi:MAG: uroporphyrinogen-III C-methyltransferase [Methylovulum sp.]|nr:uroporphyrinogen-III C-methyltransferase [Methylovulum sp.]
MAELSGQQEQTVGESTKPRRSRSGLWFGIIILLIVAGLAGAGFYLFSQLRDRQEGLGGEVKGELNKQVADYQKQLVAIQSQLAALENNIAGKDTHFTKTLADFSQLHNEKLDSIRKELNESILHIQRQLGKTRGDWLVADAEYLLTVANERLHLTGDINTTREALEASDQRLRESGDAAAFPVREQIAKELDLLRSVAIPDIVGMYARLDSLESQVDKLALILPYSGKALTLSSETHNHANADTESHDLLDRAADKLEGIVTIRHTDQPIKEILSPEEAQFIREQLRIKLEMAKIALVQHNEALYHSGLDDARHWIEQHFTKNEDSRSLIAEIGKLAAVKIQSHYPDISQSLKMLRDITKLRIETDKASEPTPTNQSPASMPPTQPPVQPLPIVPPVETQPAPTEQPDPAEPEAE